MESKTEVIRVKKEVTIDILEDIQVKDEDLDTNTLENANLNTRQEP